MSAADVQDSERLFCTYDYQLFFEVWFQRNCSTKHTDDVIPKSEKALPNSSHFVMLRLEQKKYLSGAKLIRKDFKSKGKFEAELCFRNFEIENVAN